MDSWICLEIIHLFINAWLYIEDRWVGDFVYFDENAVRLGIVIRLVLLQ